MSRIYESFFLITVPHGRQGIIPYQYPPAATNPEGHVKLPKAKDIIAFCFPDIEEIRKSRSVDHKAPPVNPAGTLASLSGLPIGNSSPTPGTPQGPNSPLAPKSNFRADFSSFTITDEDGARLMGVVFRCLPAGYGLRYDVRKRFPDCLCFITRHCNALPMFQQLLQLIHAMKLMFAPIDKIEWLLNGIYSRPIPSPGESISLRYHVSHGYTRTYNFVWPREMDVPVSDAFASVYLFQQLKPKAFVTMLSAIMCERRICFIATDMDKLYACIQAAVSLTYPLAWQHLFIPVLPTCLAPYAAGSSPIIFGIRRVQLHVLTELHMGDLIYVDLDAGELSFGPEAEPVPDIYVLPNTSQMVQAAQKLGAEAAKAADKLDKALTKGMSLLSKYTGQQLVKDADEPKPDAANLLAWELSLLSQSLPSKMVIWNGKSKVTKNEKAVFDAEQQIRDGLLAFFLNIVGDASTYLRPDRKGGLQLNVDFYLGSRGMLGDGPALSNFLNVLTETQCFARLTESRRSQVALDRDRATSPRSAELNGPFLRCVEILKQRAEPFTVNNIKKALKSTQQAPTAEGEAPVGTSGRWTVFHEGAQQLTSSYAVAGDAQQVLSSLIEDSYSSTFLPSILRVIWNRLNDSKGLRWKHAARALALLREMLIRGPETVLSDALANINLLRTFLEYKAGMGMGQGNKVRETSHDIFFLVLDMRKFMLARSVYWTRKQKYAQPKMRLVFEHCLSTSFADLHRVVTPSAEPRQPQQRASVTDLENNVDDAHAGDYGEAELADISVFTAEGVGEGEEGSPLVASRESSLSDAATRRATVGSFSSSNQSPARPAGRWETFDSGDGSMPVGVPSMAHHAAQSSWVQFGSGSGAVSQATWETFSLGQGPTVDTGATEAAQRRALSPPLIHISQSPPPPPQAVPEMLPPIEPLPTARPNSARLAEVFASPPPTAVSTYGYQMQQHSAPSQAILPMPLYSAPPAYGNPQQLGPCGMPVGAVQMPGAMPVGVVPTQGPSFAGTYGYSSAYDPFAEIEKNANK